MPSAKDLVVRPISPQAARALVQRVHYSGKTVNNSQLHFGVFLDDRLEGAMQFGPSLDKRKIMGLVEGTEWNGFLELNRMAFGERLPRNSESRALGVAFRMIRKHYPHVDWVISFADGTQCGDGTIYRASGFVLTGITINKHIWRLKSGEVVTDTNLYHATGFAVSDRRAGGGVFSNVIGRLKGFQLRYIYFLNPQARERLTVPVLPFSKIADLGAEMYRGKTIKRAKKPDDPDQGNRGRGSTDPHAPHSEAGP